jgi:hypothetical protein
VIVPKKKALVILKKLLETASRQGQTCVDETLHRNFIDEMGGSMKKASLILGVLLVLLAVLAGCGKSSSSSGAAKPTITISNLSPTTATFTHNSGTTTLTFTYEATGYNGNVTSHFEAFDNTGALAETNDTPVMSTTGLTPPIQVNHGITVDTSGMAAGDHGTYALSLTDSAGGFSNKLTGTWTVN